MFPHLKGFNLRQWIDENRGSWGQRRVIWENSDFIAFVTRGPNRRKDFHINPGDEIFYQLEGVLNLYYLGPEGKQELALLKAGDLLLLPGNVPIRHGGRMVPGRLSSSAGGGPMRGIASSGLARSAGTASTRPKFVSTIPATRSPRQPTR